MIDPRLSQHVTRLEKLFETRLGLGRGGFEKRAARARRMMPRQLRADLARVTEARHMSGHPRLARQIDMGAVEDAAGRVESHLKTVDAAERRRHILLKRLGTVMFNLLVVGTLLLVVLAWRGFL
ncbi:hypothetical protein Salmuc_02815 [Salipiger mucosus DSM 16094]|uniref:Transmembrane protein n=1 Tax=Salipiger mucosus DSM 16094 TaxID=1123237 RepID=S9SGL5_9RHOB|nr:hypothetical protein Salmuc_02815 [Salipiger mucosus DSM 16094]